MTLPSGGTLPPDRAWAVEPAPAGAADAGLWRAARRFGTHRVRAVRPSEVVGGRAQTYDVLPQEAGLLQLTEAGAIRRDPARGYWEMSFRVVRPIARFPAGLAGAHSVSFILDPSRRALQLRRQRYAARPRALASVPIPTLDPQAVTFAGMSAPGAKRTLTRQAASAATETLAFSDSDPLRRNETLQTFLGGGTSWTPGSKWLVHPNPCSLGGHGSAR